MDRPPGGTSPVSARRRRLRVDLTILAIVGVLLAAAVAATVATLYRELYSPSAFAMRYLQLLADGRASEALSIAGVSVDSAVLESAGLPPAASEALLRRDAMAQLADVEVVSEEPTDDGARVTVSYVAGAFPGTITFEVQSAGWLGVAPAWRFARSPLAVVDLTVRGSMSFEVNGFEIDKRQVSPDGVDADPLAAVPLLVFSPGVYSVSVDSPISATPGAAVLADTPLAKIPVTLQAQPTEDFVRLVQRRVDGFLDDCAEQRVLQPTGCPFGLVVQNRILDEPTWSIAQYPEIVLEPDGDGWRIPPAPAAATIAVEIQSLFDGTIREVDEQVRFEVSGTIDILPDGAANILVSGSPLE